MGGGGSRGKKNQNNNIEEEEAFFLRVLGFGMALSARVLNTSQKHKPFS